MGQVTVTIGGRRYDLACRDGEEAHLRALADQVDAKAVEVAPAVGGGGEARQLLLAALLLADELSELRGGDSQAAEAALAHQVESLAARLETLAERLEKAGEGS